MKKLSVFLMLILAISACSHNPSQPAAEKSIYVGNRLVTPQQLHHLVQVMVQNGRSVRAHGIIDTLMEQNNTNGALYYERGYIEGHDLDFRSAMADYKTAEGLGYNQTECDNMIQVCKSMLDAGTQQQQGQN